MLEANIISLVDNTNSISPMIIQHKKIRDIRICVDILGINKSYEHDPFPTPFIEETLKNIIGNEVLPFIDDLYRYHQVHIAKEYHPKITFTTKWGSFMYKIMPFVLENEPKIFLWIMIQALKDFIYDFLGVYLDD